MLRLKSQTPAPRPTLVPVQATTTTATKPVVKTRRPIKRRVWFVGLLALAAGVTGVEAMGRLLQLAENYGWRPRSATALPGGDSVLLLAYSPNLDRAAVLRRTVAKPVLEMTETSTGKLLWSRSRIFGELSFSQNGTLLFSGREVLDATTGKTLYHAPDWKNTYTTWSKNGTTAIGISHTYPKQNKILYWNIKTQKTQFLLLDPKLEYSNYTISPDGKWLSYLSYNLDANEGVCLNLRSITDSTPPQKLAMVEPQATTFSPDSKTLLYAGRKQVKIQSERTESWLNTDSVIAWSTESGKPILDFEPNEYYTKAIWSPDGRFFALQSWEKFAVFDANSQKELWSCLPSRIYDTGLTFTLSRRLYYTQTLPSKNKNRYQQELKYWDMSRVLPP